MLKKIERYDAMDGLRAYAAIGIIMMHVNVNSYKLQGFIAEKIINRMSEFVFLFMVLSGFSMCCGYYNKILKNEISLVSFYNKRYVKLLPFFALLCLVDLIISPSIESVYEIFANLTLCFGLLPNANIEVIGVGWFLGVVFVFYMLFPFYCCLISTKKRAWGTFAVALIYNLICKVYFFNNEHVVTSFDKRTNILYCAVFFLTGGLIYIYRDRIKSTIKWKISVSILCVIATIAYIIFNSNVFTIIAFSSLLLIYAIVCGNKSALLINPVTRFISSISLEIYLCHMVFFRVIERMNVLNLLYEILKSKILSYIVAVIFVLGCSIIFSIIVKRFIDKVSKMKILSNLI